MVTKDGQQRLRDQEPVPNKVLTYDIDGPIAARVTSSLNSERIGEINRGDRILNDAVTRFRRNMEKARKGQARSQFQNRAMERER